jgi:hypothetical protein
MFCKLGYIWPNIKIKRKKRKRKKEKEKRKIKLKISESSTLSLQGDVKEYSDTVYYGTPHILEDLI